MRDDHLLAYLSGEHRALSDAIDAIAEDMENNMPLDRWDGMKRAIAVVSKLRDARKEEAKLSGFELEPTKK